MKTQLTVIHREKYKLLLLNPLKGIKIPKIKT